MVVASAVAGRTMGPPDLSCMRIWSRSCGSGPGWGGGMEMPMSEELLPGVAVVALAAFLAAVV